MIKIFRRYLKNNRDKLPWCLSITRALLHSTPRKRGTNKLQGDDSARTIPCQRLRVLSHLRREVPCSIPQGNWENVRLDVPASWRLARLVLGWLFAGLVLLQSDLKVWAGRGFHASVDKDASDAYSAIVSQKSTWTFLQLLITSILTPCIWGSFDECSILTEVAEPDVTSLRAYEGRVEFAVHEEDQDHAASKSDFNWLRSWTSFHWVTVPAGSALVSACLIPQMDDCQLVKTASFQIWSRKSKGTNNPFYKKTKAYSLTSSFDTCILLRLLILLGLQQAVAWRTWHTDLPLQRCISCRDQRWYMSFDGCSERLLQVKAATAGLQQQVWRPCQSSSFPFYYYFLSDILWSTPFEELAVRKTSQRSRQGIDSTTSCTEDVLNRFVESFSGQLRLQQTDSLCHSSLRGEYAADLNARVWGAHDRGLIPNTIKCNG